MLEQDHGAPVSGHIRSQNGFVAIDFRGCSSRAVSEIYQRFALYCACQQVRWAMLKAGSEDPDAHFALRDTLVTLARIAEVPLSFKLALVAAPGPMANAYVIVAAELALLGCDVQVFRAEPEARQWLLGFAREPARRVEPPAPRFVPAAA